MIWLLPLVLLLAAGIYIGYAVSPASGAWKRASKAVSTLQTIDSELRSQYQNIQNSLSQAANSYIQEVRAERLRNIPLDELKRHGSGMRLQALKDAGLRTLADIQGWNENRLAQVRGVGPKSASSIAHLAYRLSSASNSLPILPPRPPFVLDRDRTLLQAIYRDCWFEGHLSQLRGTFEETIKTFEGRLAQVHAATGFMRWLPGLGANDAVRSGIAEADVLCRDLEGASPAAKVREEVSTGLATFRAICSNRIDLEVIAGDYKEKQILYDWLLAKNLGDPGRPGQRPTLPNPSQPAAIPSASSLPAVDGTTGDEALPFPDAVLPDSSPIEGHKRSAGHYSSLVTDGDNQNAYAASAAGSIEDELVHVEFGRVVKGAAPEPLPRPESHLVPHPRVATSTGEAIEPKKDSPVQASKELREAFVTFRVGSGPQLPTQEFALPTQLRPNGSKTVRWLPKGEAVKVQGISITNGLFFYGEPGSGGEQCAIDPALPAKIGVEAPSEFTNYYHSYAGLTPDQRFRYLAWLSAGAANCDDPGFGSLYFSGLERRLLQITAGHEKDAAAEEHQQIIREISRLADLFQGTKGAVTHYGRRLLGYIEACSLSESSLPELPESWERAYELPPSLLYGLGYLTKEKRPVPVEWALRWAYLEPTIFLRTPATRCKCEYEAAFAHVYRERYGSGLVIAPNKTILKIRYQPIFYSPTLSENEFKFAGIPDIQALTAPQQSLREIVEQSTAMVDSYSRFLGRNATKADTLEARLTLSSRCRDAVASGTKCVSRLRQCDQGKDEFAENLAELRLPIRRLAGILREDWHGVAARNPADDSDLSQHTSDRG